MTYTAEQVVAKYIELRDRKAAMAKRHSEEMKPITDAMGKIENYLLNQMNMVGCDSIKTCEGTAYKARAASVKASDMEAFKDFVFDPAVCAVERYLTSTGYDVPPSVADHIAYLLKSMAMWDMVDFRAGKKGITDYIDAEQKPVPGVGVEYVTTVNIRRN